MRAVFLPLLLLLHTFPIWGQDCGQRSDGFKPIRRKSRIYNGEESPVGKWPWQVLISFHSINVTEERICGGTVIADRWILTAAHCMEKVLKVNSIIFGSVDGEETDPKKMAHAKNNIVHNEYARASQDEKEYNYKHINDIALIELVEPIAFDATVQPICLPSPNTTIPRDAKVAATGFGNWGDPAIRNDKQEYPLLETVFPIIPEDVCWNKLVKVFDEGFSLSDTQICGFGLGSAFGHGTGQGDIGGPLAMYSKSGRWFEVGITSWGGEPHDQYIEPGVYTNVKMYCDWIEEKTGGEAKCIDAELVDASL